MRELDAWKTQTKIIKINLAGTEQLQVFWIYFISLSDFERLCKVIMTAKELIFGTVVINLNQGPLIVTIKTWQLWKIIYFIVTVSRLTLPSGSY